MESEPIIGVILAAGKGSRMAQLPTMLPKPGLPVLGKPIICHQLDLMADLGIRKVIVVVGHLGFEIVREIERLPSRDLDIHYVHQEETLGIAHCVRLLEPLIDLPFLLMLGDIYFQNPRFPELLALFREQKPDAVLGAIEESSDEALRRNFCIVPADDGKVRRVIEKPRFPRSRLKGIGLYLFTPLVFDAVRRTPRTAMRDEYEITDSIQIMVDDGGNVLTSCCVDADMNVTEPKDLLEVNLAALDHGQIESYVHPTARLEKNAVVQRSVIGRGAHIGADAVLEEAVVFAETVVPAGAVIRRALATPQGVIRFDSKRGNHL